MLDPFVRGFGNFFFLHIMGRWVAGSKAEDAVAYCKRINALGSSGIINFLGEHYEESVMAQKSVIEYKHLIDVIHSQRTKCAITIKPSQFGFNALDIEDPKSLCEDNMMAVLKYASVKDIMTWLDMEDSRYTDFTLSFYKKYQSNFKLGICLQANLKRTMEDLSSLIKLGTTSEVNVRLVKGTYDEKTDAYLNAQAVHKRFLELITIAFESSPSSLGIAVGTHHTEAIELALNLSKKHKKRFFEIEVLKGVLPSYYRKLRKRNVPLSEYVPYGPDAFAYSVRRARKNPAFAKSILFAPFFDAYNNIYG